VSLNIKSPATVALAGELARRQGISNTAAIHQALSERLRCIGFGNAAEERLLGELRAIRERMARLPELDSRSDEEIIGYDGHGIPSAIVAMLRNGPEAAIFEKALVASAVGLVPATCVLEACMVLVSRRGEHALAEIDLWLSKIEGDIIPFWSIWRRRCG
jgi:antitoxin VapB